MSGVESKEITKAELTVLTRLMKNQIWHLPVHAEGGLNKETKASASTSIWEKLPSSPHRDARQFSSSPYVPHTFQAAVPALDLRASESVSK